MARDSNHGATPRFFDEKSVCAWQVQPQDIADVV
jgi:hypothetical protein